MIHYPPAVEVEDRILQSHSTARNIHFFLYWDKSSTLPLVKVECTLDAELADHWATEDLLNFR